MTDTTAEPTQGGSTELKVTRPFDGTPLATLERTSEEAAFAALARAHALYADRTAWLDAATRISILERFAERVSAEAEALALQAASEGGKPLKDSRIEIERAVSGIKVACAEIAQLHGTEVPMRLSAASAHRCAYTYREPRGVVLAISAFNHPFNLIIHQVVTAVAVGCPVLVKPASSTPLSCLRIVELLRDVGLPDGWCTCILPENRVATKLVADTRISFLSFIGSAKVGWMLRSKLAPGATCALEHGGAAPVIIDETADLDRCVPLLARGGFYHAGQVCVSVQRIYVQRKLAGTLAEKLVEAARAMKVGDPTHADTDIGPLIDPGEVDRVHEWIGEARASGAEVLCGGEKLGATCYAPTVLLNPSDEARVSREEVFGPVVAVYTYDTMDEAIARANAPDLFFQASIFTQDIDTALSVSRRLHGMTVMVNDHTAFRVDWMPFGGHRQSGLGLGGIGHSMRDMTLERMVVFHSPGLC